MITAVLTKQRFHPFSKQSLTLSACKQPHSGRLDLHCVLYPHYKKVFSLHRLTKYNPPSDIVTQNGTR